MAVPRSLRIPLGAIQRRLPKQAVHLVCIAIRPVREQQTQGKVGAALIDLASARVGIGVQITRPERLKRRPIGGSQRLRHDLGIGVGERRTGTERAAGSSFASSGARVA